MDETCLKFAFPFVAAVDHQCSLCSSVFPDISSIKVM